MCNKKKTYVSVLYRLKFYYNHHKKSKVIITMYILNKSIRLHKIVLMIKTTTYPYGTNAFKVCESEMLSKYK